MLERKVSIVEKKVIEGIPVLFVYKKGKKNLIFVFHKLLENKESELGLAYRLSIEGFFVVVIDMHGHGEREGSFEIQGLYDFNNLVIDCYKTALDVDKILCYLCNHEEYDIDMNSISCLGVSIGANVALITGYLNINISRVISIIGSLDWETPVKENKYSYFRMYAMDKHVIQYEKVKYDIDKYHPTKHYANLVNLPQILFLNGRLDMTVPYESAKKEINQLEKIYYENGKKHLINYKAYSKAGHNVTYSMINDLVFWLKGGDILHSSGCTN